jgi:hypothetical protein
MKTRLENNYDSLRARLHEKLSSYGNKAGASPSFKDTRSDLGYGRITNKWHDQRQGNSFFPYLDPVEDSEEVNDLDDHELELVDLISKKTNADIAVNDPYAGYKTNPFAFAGSNSSLTVSDCFYRPDKVLREIAAMNSSIVSMPGTWRKAVKGGGQGASVYLTVAHPVRTGMLKGWSSAPFDNDNIYDNVEDEENTNEEDEDFLSIWDIIKKNAVF